ncbi:MAG: hypothetical protein ACI9SG_002462 [Maribacter sp.]|jgi:uncharacterized protein
MRYLKASLSFLLLMYFLPIWGQFEIPEKPEIETSVYDYINLLSVVQKNALEQKLIRYSDSTSTQIVVAIIASSEGENITYLGAQWGQKWGIGQAGKDNGVLLILARDDRKIAINTGYGVEGNLTDAMSRRIIETVIVPKFKTGDYYGGLNNGADTIFKVLNGEFTEDRSAKKEERFPLRSLFPFIVFFIILIILSKRNKGGGNGNGGRKNKGLNLLDIIILSNMGRSGRTGGGFGGGGSFGGGGFGGGFGGGGFGGGGASGGW